MALGNIARYMSEHSWVIDSGATAYMYHDKTAFYTFSFKIKVTSVTIGDGTPLPVKGVGTIHACTVFEGFKREVRLTNVLHVPKILCNLLSVSRFRASILHVVFETPSN